MQNDAVEIRFQLHATGLGPTGRGPSCTPAPAEGRLPRVTQVLALAVHFQDMIERGEARDYADLARLGCLARERISQIMELIWLAPDIQAEILNFVTTDPGRFPISEVAVRKITDLLSWKAQRENWQLLKKSTL